MKLRKNQVPFFRGVLPEQTSIPPISWDTHGTLAGNKAQNTITSHNNESVINQKVMCYESLSKVVVYAFPKTHNLKVVGSNPTPATKEIKASRAFPKIKKITGYTPGVPENECNFRWGKPFLILILTTALSGAFVALFLFLMQTPPLALFLMDARAREAYDYGMRHIVAKEQWEALPQAEKDALLGEPLPAPAAKQHFAVKKGSKKKPSR